MLVVDAGCLQEAPQLGDGWLALRRAGSLHDHDRVEGPAGCELTGKCGDDLVTLVVRDGLPLSAGVHSERLLGLEVVPRRLPAGALRHVVRDQSLVLVEQFGQHHLGISGAVGVHRDERCGLQLRLGGAALGIGTRAHGVHEHRRGRPLRGARVLAIPSLGLAVRVEQPRCAPFGMIWVDDLDGGNLPKVGLRALVGHKTGVEQRISDVPLRHRQIARPDQRWGPVAAISLVRKGKHRRSEHLDGRAHSLEARVKGPLAFGKINQRRVKRIRTTDSFAERRVVSTGL